MRRQSRLEILNVPFCPSDMGVEEIFADVDADPDAAHGGKLRNREEERRGPKAFLFQLVNAGFVPSDYPNHGTPIPERTQLTPGPGKS